MVEKNHSFFLANYYYYFVIIFSEAYVPYKIVMIKNTQKPHSSVPKIPSINTMTSLRIIPICQQKSRPLCSGPLSWIFSNYFFNRDLPVLTFLIFTSFTASCCSAGFFPLFTAVDIAGLRTLKTAQKKYDDFKTIRRPKWPVTSFAHHSFPRTLELSGRHPVVRVAVKAGLKLI